MFRTGAMRKRDSPTRSRPRLVSRTKNSQLPLRERHLDAVILECLPDHQHQIGVDVVFSVVDFLHPELDEDIDAGLAEVLDLRVGQFLLGLIRAVDHLRMRLHGFLHQFEQHYLATWRGQSGFFVHTPMRLPDGRFVFVNRGFVPYDRKEPQTRPEGQIEGEISIEGLARIAPEDKPSIIIPDNDPGQNIFYWKDLSEMIRSAGLSENEVYPFFVDVNSAPNPGGLPIGGVTRVNLPNNHLQYAVTWYGLALALVCVLFAWFWRGTGPRSDKT